MLTYSLPCGLGKKHNWAAPHCIPLAYIITQLNEVTGKANTLPCGRKHAHQLRLHVPPLSLSLSCASFIMFDCG